MSYKYFFGGGGSYLFIFFKSIFNKIMVSKVVLIYISKYSQKWKFKTLKWVVKWDYLKNSTFTL